MSKFRTNICFDTNHFELLLVLNSFQNSDFQSQFFMSKIIRIKKKKSLNNINFHYEALYFLNMCPIFVCLDVVQSSSYQKDIGTEFTHCDLPQPWTLT